MYVGTCFCSRPGCRPLPLAPKLSHRSISSSVALCLPTEVPVVDARIGCQTPGPLSDSFDLKLGASEALRTALQTAGSQYFFEAWYRPTGAVEQQQAVNFSFVLYSPYLDLQSTQNNGLLTQHQIVYTKTGMRISHRGNYLRQFRGPGIIQRSPTRAGGTDGKLSEVICTDPISPRSCVPT